MSNGPTTLTELARSIKCQGLMYLARYCIHTSPSVTNCMFRCKRTHILRRTPCRQTAMRILYAHTWQELAYTWQYEGSLVRGTLRGSSPICCLPTSCLLLQGTGTAQRSRSQETLLALSVSNSDSRTPSGMLVGVSQTCNRAQDMVIRRLSHAAAASHGRCYECSDASPDGTHKLLQHRDHARLDSQ